MCHKKKKNRNKTKDEKVNNGVFLYVCLYAVINCSALVPPANGAVSPSSCLSRSTYGQTCSFFCLTKGFYLEGTSSRVCGKEGDWTGINDTVCRGDDQSCSK